jgi:hypothetical protein
MITGASRELILRPLGPRDGRVSRKVVKHHASATQTGEAPPHLRGWWRGRSAPGPPEAKKDLQLRLITNMPALRMVHSEGIRRRRIAAYLLEKKATRLWPEPIVTLQ